MPKTPEPVPQPTPDADDLRREVQAGLVACHRADAQRTRETFEAGVAVTALMELLIAKGVIGLTELDERRQRVGEQVAAQRARTWTGPTLYPDGDPAAPPVLVDCEARLPLCGAACCTIYSVYLTAEEVRGGKLLWELGEPYRLPRGPDGHCAYLDLETRRCKTWRDRPHVCRRYSCDKEPRIWEDFDGRIINPELLLRRRRAAAAGGGGQEEEER